MILVISLIALAAVAVATRVGAVRGFIFGNQPSA